MPGESEEFRGVQGGQWMAALQCSRIQPRCLGGEQRRWQAGGQTGKQTMALEAGS